MTLFKRLRYAIHRAREATGLVFYMRPRRISVSYEATVHNTSRGVKRFIIALPVPPNTDQQTVLHAPMYKPDAAAILTDSEFGNRYAIFEGSLRPSEVASYQCGFMVRVVPRHVVPHQSHALTDYPVPPGHGSQPYIKPNRFIRPDDQHIAELSNRIRGQETDVWALIKRLNHYVVTHLRYGDPITGLYSSLDALNLPRIDCGGFDSLLAALCIRQGMPARIVSGFWADRSRGNGMHAWVEIMLPDGTWVPADPSVEQLRHAGRSRRSGSLGFVGSDRITLSQGCDIPLEIGGATIRADILQHPFVWSADGTEGLLARAGVRIPKVWRG